MAGMRIDDVSLDTNEEWLIRNALACYREACVACVESEADEARRARERDNTDALLRAHYADIARAHDRLSGGWAETVARVDALMEKLG